MPAATAGSDDDLVPLSALQHFLFCPRQCALIHVERACAENALTAEGRLVHEKVHEPAQEKRKGVRSVTGMPLRSAALGLVGVADLVELRDMPAGTVPFPVEHKLGRPKAHRADEVQLCAQGLCLEEMLGVPVPAGALFYGRTRRRQDVAFDAELRAVTRRVADDTRALLASGRTPAAVYEPKRCDSCSLFELCRPKALETFRLDPAVGFLHRDRPGRPSLALDLLEEFRPVMADRLALSLINRRQLGPRDFRHMENGAVLLADEARKALITAFQERKKEEMQHPFLQEKAPLGLMPQLQAQLLARHLRGDLDGYPPFVWR